MMELGKGYQVKHLSTKIQEMTSNVVITQKNVYHITGIPGTQRAFSDKVAPDIDVLTDEPVVQCDVQVAENT